MKKASGFTIVELLIVIVVIAILAAITIVAYNGVSARANDSRRKSDLSQLARSLSAYAVTHDGDMIAGGSGCGGSGNGVGFYNYNYPTYTSISDCMISKGAVSKEIKDPSGSASCSGLTCRAYMKYTCLAGTFFYANLETGTHDGTEMDGTCYADADTAYGMNYYVKVTE